MNVQTLFLGLFLAFFAAFSAHASMPVAENAASMPLERAKPKVLAPAARGYPLKPRPMALPPSRRLLPVTADKNLLKKKQLSAVETHEEASAAQLIALFPSE